MGTARDEDASSHAARGTRYAVLLLGDSIRLGYAPFVAEALAGEAAVWGPDANGADTAHTLTHLDSWLAGRRPTVVHLNCGLHDLKRNAGAAGTAVPLPEYAANLRRIVAALRDATGATVVFATTTPVSDARHAARGAGFDRYERDVEDYNAAARAVCADLRVPVNDLHRVVTAAGRDALLLPDGTHYTEAGYRLLAAAVAMVMRGVAKSLSG